MATATQLKMLVKIHFEEARIENERIQRNVEGKFVFTCSKGLTGIGLDRKHNGKIGSLGWEDIRGEQVDENTFADTALTHTHTINPVKSEFYGASNKPLSSPYTRCDRIADYRVAWAHFKKRFNK